MRYTCDALLILHSGTRIVLLLKRPAFQLLTHSSLTASLRTAEAHLQRVGVLRPLNLQTPDEQRDRKVNQHHVLRVFCKQRRFDVERMQGFASLTAL